MAVDKDEFQHGVTLVVFIVIILSFLYGLGRPGPTGAATIIP